MPHDVLVAVTRQPLSAGVPVSDPGTVNEVDHSRRFSTRSRKKAWFIRWPFAHGDSTPVTRQTSEVGSGSNAGWRGRREPGAPDPALAWD